MSETAARRAMAHDGWYGRWCGFGAVMFALAAIFKAVNSGTYNYIKEVREYGKKASIMKELFVK